MGRARWIVFIVVIAGGVALAVHYVEGVFDRRSKEIESISKAGSPPPPPQPPRQGPPPLDRSTSRADDVLIVTRAGGNSGGRRLMVARGNGEFSRIASGPAEPGPTVRGVLDRAGLDDLIRPLLQETAGDSRPDDPVAVRIRLNGKVIDRRVREEDVAAMLRAQGRNAEANAVPAQVVVQVEPLDGAVPADAPAWPLRRVPPESLLEPKRVALDADRAKASATLRDLAPGSVLKAGATSWRVRALELLTLASDA